MVQSMNPVKDDADPLLRLVADSVPALMAYYELPALRCRFANRRYAEYNGWTTHSILGKTVREVIGESAWQMIEPHVIEVMAGQLVQYQRTQTLPSGQQRKIDVSLIPHFAKDGEQIGAFVLINDVTEHWRAEQAIRENEIRMRKFFEATEEGIVFITNGVIVDANEAIARMVGYSVKELIGRHNIDFIPEGRRQTVVEHIRNKFEEPYESELLHRDGHVIPVEFSGKSMLYQGEMHRLTVVRDITQRKQAQARIEFLAMHDMLTELPNRRYLDEYMSRLLTLARRQNKRLAVLFADLDDFKDINDKLGHAAGDAVLREVSRRLRASVRESDVVVRLGGDEFLMVLTDLEQADDVTRAAEQLVHTLQAPVLINGQEARMHASIGISLFPEHGDSTDELIRHADAAMYQAKLGGGRSYRFYSAGE